MTTQRQCTTEPAFETQPASTQDYARAVAGKTDVELDKWIDVCRAKCGRIAIATTARHQWKWLLQEALAQRERSDEPGDAEEVERRRLASEPVMHKLQTLTAKHIAPGETTLRPSPRQRRTGARRD